MRASCEWYVASDTSKSAYSSTFPSASKATLLSLPKPTKDKVLKCPRIWRTIHSHHHTNVLFTNSFVIHSYLSSPHFLNNPQGPICIADIVYLLECG